MMLLSFAAFVAGGVIAGQFPEGVARGLIVATGALFAFGVSLTAVVLTRCPNCGWLLTMTQTKAGVPCSHPWVDKVCSNCKRDLMEPVDPAA